MNKPHTFFGLGHNIGHSVGWVERSETQQLIGVGFRSSTQPTGNSDGLKYEQGPFFKAMIRAFILGCLIFSHTAFASTPETLAVLSFDINADKNLDYIKKGISTMLYSRLTCPEKVVVVPPKRMTSLEAGLENFSGRDLVHETATRTGSRYVLYGTITSLAGAFSIDAKVFDTAEKQYMAFFEQSKNSDDLIKKVDRIAAAINHKVFNRTTVTWEQMEQEKQQKRNKLKNQNPEKLMQMSTGWQREEKVGWKVWKYLF